MKDPYTLESPTRREVVPPAERPRTPRRAWVLLVVGLVVNVAGSSGALPLLVGAAGGLLALLGLATLVTSRRSRR